MLALPQQPRLSRRTRQPAASSSSIAARPTAGSVNVVNESARNTRSPRAPALADGLRRRCQRISVSRVTRGSGRLRAIPRRLSISARSGRSRPGRFDNGAAAAPSRLSRRIEPKSFDRSGTPWISW